MPEPAGTPNFLQLILKPPTPENGVGSLRAERLQTPLGLGAQILKGAVAGGASRAFEFFSKTTLGQQAQEQVVQSKAGEFVTQNWPLLAAGGGLLLFLAIRGAK